MKKLLYIGSINLGILLAILLSMEIASRALLPRGEIQTIFNDEKLRTRGRSFVESNPSRGFALKPGYSDGLYTINSKGFRGKEFHDLSNKRVILALGESTTFGWGVKDDQTYPFFLGQLLGKRGEIQVVNGGIPSYTSSQTLAYLRKILAEKELKPSMVLVSIVWNDIWYSTISNWYPDILIYQKPPQWITFLTSHSRFINGLIMGFSKNDQLIDVCNEAALVQYGKNIEAMIVSCREKGVDLVFVEPPFDSDHMPEKGLNEFHVRYSKAFFIKTAQTYLGKLHSLAAKFGVPVVSHRLDMGNLHQKPLFMDTLHPTAEGNGMMAYDIYEKIIPLLGLEPAKTAVQ